MDREKISSENRIRHPKALFAILAMALILRLIWAWLIKVEPVSDSYAYLVLARSVAAGTGYAWADGTLTAYWPPGASFIYAAMFVLFGDGYVSIVVLHLVAGVLVVYLGYRLAGLLMGEAAGLLTAALLAAWPILIQFTTILASEILFLVPVLLATVIVLEVRKRNIACHLLFGFLIAVASYIRPTALPLLVLLPLAAAVRYWDARPLLGWIGVGGLMCALMIAPWAYRNTQIFGQFTTISTNFGANFWMGNNPESSGAYQSIDRFSDEVNEKRRDDRLRREAITFIRDHPLEFLRLGVRRAIITFDRETIGVVWNEKGIQERFGDRPIVLTLLKLWSTLYWYAALLLSVIGFILLVMRERWKTLGNPLIIMAALFAAIPVIMVGQDRYHMPMNPMVASFAAVAMLQIRMWWLRRT